jgi:hypothetical protein
VDSTVACYALRHLGRRHPSVNVFRLLEQRLRETGSVTPTALVKAGRPRTLRTPVNEYAIITAVEQLPWRTKFRVFWDVAPCSHVQVD